MRLLSLIFSIIALLFSLLAYRNVQKLAPVTQAVERSQSMAETAREKTETVRQRFGELLVDLGQWVKR